MPDCHNDALGLLDSVGSNESLVHSASGLPMLWHDKGVCDYQESLQAMLKFTQDRDDDTLDEIWFVQHRPVYTQGTACTQNPLSDSDITVVKTDRGGQITYHGPGQLVMYPLLKLKRFSLGVKSLVDTLEQAVIDVLLDYGVSAKRKDGAPGVYVDQAKIAALGLRIRRGCSYHGLSLNVAMDLTPFTNIDPCGYQGLQVTQLQGRGDVGLTKTVDMQIIQQQLLQHFIRLI